MTTTNAPCQGQLKEHQDMCLSTQHALKMVPLKLGSIPVKIVTR